MRSGLGASLGIADPCEHDDELAWETLLKVKIKNCVLPSSFIEWTILLT